MNEQQNNKPDERDEIGEELESGSEVNDEIEKQGEDAAEGIPQDTDAAKHDHQADNRQ